MKKLKILLIGQPNVGKSSLLNVLVGSKVVVSNYPGTTVEISTAKKIFNNREIYFQDTPGIYSISDRSEEEKITEKALFEQKIDGAVIIADATSLERSLYITLQVLEAGIPIVLALNFVEEARKKGIKIDHEKLEKILNVPVVAINPITKKGVEKLLDEILKIERKTGESFKIEYDDHIEKAIETVASQIKNQLNKRFIAIRILEEDEDFYKYLSDKKIIKEAKQNLKDHPEIAKDISITRYGTAAFIAQKVSQMIGFKKGEIFEEKIDHLFLHKVWGPIITGLFLIIIFGLLLKIGNWTQGLLMTWTNNILSSFTIGNSFLSLILTQGLTGLMAGISIALPYVLLFYFFLGLLEDIGLLSRFIVNAERFLKKLGLPGKSFIPLALGLGCTAPATRSTRILSTKKEQLYTASFFAFVPCSSRIAIIMGVVGFYGGSWLALAVFATLFFAGFIWAFVAKKITNFKREPLLLELPPYRKPLIKNVFAKSWIRMKDFVYIVIPLLAAGGIIYGLLDILGITNSLIEPLSFITNWLKLPAETIIPLLFGFLQKDLVGAMLISVLGGNISFLLSPLQIYTFGVAATIGIPCIIALGMLWKEFGFKRALTLTIGSIGYGLLFAGLMSRTIGLFG